MTSHSSIRSADFVRNYRTLLQDLNSNRFHRITPKIPSPKQRYYSPKMTVSTAEASPVFVPLFYAGEKGALGIWDKTSGTGYVKRRLDEEDRSYHVLDLSNPRNNLGTFISAPNTALQALHITLPNMVLVMKNYRRNFGFDVLIMDSNAYRRRFSFATWYNPVALKKYSFMCQVSLRLESGWNEIHVNFNELVKSTYKTSYVETIRIQIYANCKLRQVFFCDDKIVKGDVPIPSMKDFENIRTIPLDYGPRTHPDAIEPGPDRKRHLPYIEPPAQISPTRLEQDLKIFQRKRFTEVSKQRLALQPYKTYFRELLHEEKQKKKLVNAIETALKAEVAAKVKEAGEEGPNEVSVLQNTDNNNPDGEIPGLSKASPTSSIAPAEKQPMPVEDTPNKSLTKVEDKEVNVVRVPTPSTPSTPNKL